MSPASHPDEMCRPEHTCVRDGSVHVIRGSCGALRRNSDEGIEVSLLNVLD